MRALAPFLLVCLIAANGCVSPRRLVSPGSNNGNSEFSVSVTPTTQAVTAGGQATFTVSVTPQSGFTGTVSFSAQAGGGVTTNVSPASITGGSGTTTLTVLTSSATPASNITITLTAVDPANNVSASTSVTLSVQSSPSTMAATVPTVCVNADAGQGPQPDGAPAAPGAHGFVATFAATPSQPAMDGAVGFFAPNHGDQQVFGAFVRFSPAGLIQARDGADFTASTNIPYAAGETYRFRLVANLPAVTYSAFVTPPGGSELLLGANLQVPPEQRGAATVTGGGLAAIAPDGASLTVCSFSLR